MVEIEKIQEKKRDLPFDPDEAKETKFQLSNTASSLRLFDEVLAFRGSMPGDKALAEPPKAGADTKAQPADRAIERRAVAGDAPSTSVLKGGKDGEQFQLHYNAQGQVDKITLSISGAVKGELQAGKDFKLGSVEALKDGSVKMAAIDGRHSVTIGSDFSRVTKELGDKPDGSADRTVQVITAQGVQRDLVWEQVPGGPPGAKQIKSITDTLHTANGDLVETTTRKQGEMFELTTNYGKKATRMNVAIAENGDFKYTQLEVPKISRPNDIADARGSVLQARKHFLDVAEKHGLSRSEMNEWGRKFELNCYQAATYGRMQPSDQQMRKTYHEAELMLEANNAKTPLSSRKQAVKEGFQALARPQEYVNQFQHPSCAFASTETIIGLASPGDQMRLVREMLVDGKFVSKVPVKDGNRMVVKFSDKQLTPHSDWPNAFYNQLCQTAAIKLAYPGYTECGEDGSFPGGDDSQMRKVKQWVTGNDHLMVVGRYGQIGGNHSFSEVQKELKQYGPIGFVIPGHMMCIIGARVKNGVQQVLVKNTWGQQGEKNSTGTGWVDYNNI